MINKLIDKRKITEIFPESAMTIWGTKVGKYGAILIKTESYPK